MSAIDNPKIITCPVCIGNGKLEVRDRMKELLRLFASLTHDDQQEVLFYADYLKVKRRKK